MIEDRVQLYCGKGSGRSAAAIGQGVRYAAAGKRVIVVRFLKGKASLDLDYLKKLEPEIKLFCFDKFDDCYNDLTRSEQKEERIHIKTGFAFARKELITGDCDVLILDEVLDLVAMKIIEEQEVISLIESAGENAILIMTGSHRCEQLWDYATRVTEVTTLKS